MEETQSKPCRSQRLASQPSLPPEVRPIQTKRSCLTESSSSGLLKTFVSTSSETPVTPIISGSAFREEVPQLQEDIRTDPSVTVDTSVPETPPSRVDLEPISVQIEATFELVVVQEPPFETKVHLPEHLYVEFQYLEGVTPSVSVTAEAIPSSAPEIIYGPDGLPLPPGLIAIKEIAGDRPSSTPFHFGTGIHLYPSTPGFDSFNPPSSQVSVESLGELLDRLNMSEQP